jgi:hypothetical protein
MLWGGGAEAGESGGRRACRRRGFMVRWVWDRAAPFAGWPLGLWPPDLNLADGIGVPSKKNSQHQAES